MPPRPAEGIELIGEYEGSGFREAPYLARRADGQTIQLTRLLYLVAEAADGHRDAAAMAERVSADYGKEVSADNIEHLVDSKLRPLGVLTAPDGSSPPMERPDALLSLKFKTSVVPERFVRALCTLFKPLFPGVVVVAVLAGLLAFDIWLFFVNGVGEAMRDTLYARLQASRLSGPATVAKADKLADKVRAILQNEVRPVGESTRSLIEDRRFRSFSDGPPQQSSTTVAVAA